MAWRNSMKKNNLHLVPQPVIDCAENLIKATNQNTKDLYTLRLETIRDYCDDMLKKVPTKPMFDDLHYRKVRER